MADFKYQAYDSEGNSRKGHIEAIDKLTATKRLNEQGLKPAKLEPVSTQIGGLFGEKRLTLDDIEFLTAELSLLLRSGVKIDRGLEIVKRSKSNLALKALLDDVCQKVKQGTMLSTSLAAYPEYFDPLYINLVKMGEETGTLPDIFASLAEDLKFKKDLKRKALQALVYPMVILSVCVVCIVFVFNFIVPQLSSLFDNVKDLPSYTRILLGTSDFFINYQFFLLALIIASAFAIRTFLNKSEGKQKFDRFFLHTPVISTFVVVMERIRFNSSMAMMLNAGLSLDKAILLALDSVKNSVVKLELLTVQKQIREGGRLTEKLSQSVIYPDFYVSLLEVAEESGDMSIAFDEVASRSKVEFESWTTKITNLLEPILILFMGGIVGSVVVVMLLSIVSINDFG
ncbi:type II secretion system F family protein [Shewanella eurypsychrophilus]|uniref:Type II secretion system F family protein n=1 Tax=Shewanella eurypsychrophilus TaxID=2593656 RepID=A0ABX6V9Y9_9GAMM|nr:MULTISPECIES: type II secretion system F family protein [Shewanella]QFU23454.1 type II secretion system F family protein [Shewanella sp. YLB-09]QPG58683.1 type II secretion system F family protein [Shewanella eurypsychrophilus]